MKIGGVRPGGGILPVRPERSVTTKYKTANSLSSAPVQDTVSLAGIPEAELTPKVQGAINQLLQEVGNLRRELEQSRRRISYLEQLADQDTLLPVYNRRAFVRELSRAISYSERHGEPTSLVYIDLNDFKEVNDRLGHSAGDIALQAVAGVLLERVRESDAVGRLGGDEFGIVLWRSDETAAKAKAKELMMAISESDITFNDETFRIQAALGTTTFVDGKSAEDLMADADAAMYQNKIETKGPDNIR